MPLDFPAGPITGATYTAPNGTIWVWDGAKWTNGVYIGTAYAPINSPVLTGDPQAPTPSTADNDTSIATTAFVKAQGYAPLASPTFTGTPAAPTVAATAAAGTTQLATTAFVRNGTTTNDNALAGQVGEFISSQVLLGGAVALTTNVGANVTSISLTAGDWDVRGVVGFNPAGSTTIASIQAGVSLTSGSIPGVSTSHGFAILTAAFTTGIGQALPLSTTRISIASTTTVYLVALSTFGVSTMGAYGAIDARRMR